MKNHSNIDTVISKFLDDQATEDEKIFLVEWIKDPENKSYLEDYIKTEIWIKYSFNSSVIEKQLSVLSIVTEPKRKKARSSFVKYAVIYIGVLTSATLIYFSQNHVNDQIMDESMITLEINDGVSRFFSLENQEGLNLKDNSIVFESNLLLKYESYLNNNQKSSIHEYHTLHVPYGKTFKVQFSDGSLVHINSGSKLTYPKSFNEFNLREVTLEGEAYFKVSKSDIPFQVNVDGISTTVLGTEFNISAYKNDTLKEVILVEGSVQVSENDSKERYMPSIMVPNQRATKQNQSTGLVIDQVDIKNHIAWMEGILVFEKENINAIIKKLERRFNITIRNNYKKLNALSYSGRFKNENINDILKTMQAHTNFSYIVEGKTLTINNPNNKRPMEQH
ncbi:FecR family protein [Flagellimonas sp. 389]|uniref:FecR family protein n=1 Tax=Flagellimonas sp. 389 TaxID=2835862 RepID=UPI001BD49D6E|nr:FecR family protein [Flagellimonas sp. 389]MBS9462991.1 FecR family protein [Flagellimonas sp. 389]